MTPAETDEPAVDDATGTAEATAEALGRDGVIASSRSALQEVTLWRDADGSLSMTIDDYWQFSSTDEHRFHELLVDPAMVAAPRVAKVVILGGGDGLAARNVLRYPGVESLTLVELDPQVLAMARDLAPLRALNEDSLHDPRVTVVVGDARAWVRAQVEAQAHFDVIICDFPALTDPHLASLFSPEFYADVRALCGAEAAVSVQVSLDPPGFWPVLRALESAFAWVEPRLVELADDDNWANFVLAGPRPLTSPSRPFAAQASVLRGCDPGSLVIQNRDGDRFHTVAYGDRPDYSS